MSNNDYYSIPWNLLYTFCGLFLGYFLGKYRERHNRHHATEFNKAATKFRNAFMPIIEVLNPAEFALEKDLAIFLGDNFNNLRKAVIEFSYFLGSNTKRKFLNAWHEYYRHPDHTDKNYVPFFAQYTCVGKTLKQQYEIKQLVQSKIDKILEFAKPK